MNRVATRTIVEQYRSDYLGPTDWHWRKTSEHITEMKRYVEENNITLVVMVFPHFYYMKDYSFNSIHDLIMTFCRDHGIRAIDLLPLYEGKDEGEFHVHPNDMHPNAHAHDLAAQALYKEIQQIVRDLGPSMDGGSTGITILEGAPPFFEIQDVTVTSSKVNMSVNVINEYSLITDCGLLIDDEPYSWTDNVNGTVLWELDLGEGNHTARVCCEDEKKNYGCRLSTITVIPFPTMLPPVHTPVSEVQSEDVGTRGGSSRQNPPTPRKDPSFDIGPAWKFRTGSAIFPPFLIEAGNVYATSTDGHLYAINAMTGSIQWSFHKEGFHRLSTPFVSNEKVFFTSEDMFVYALDVDRGEILWTYYTNQAGLLLPPVGGDGLIFISTDGSQIIALDEATGQYVWNRTLGVGLKSQPFYANGILYVSSSNANVYALDGKTGEKKWMYQSHGSVGASPNVVDGIVYFSSADGVIYALDAMNGLEIWTFQTNSSIITSPVLADGLLYIPSSEIYALDAKNGDVHWKVEKGINPSLSPIIKDGVLFVGTIDQYIHALDPSDGSDVWIYRTNNPIVSITRSMDGSLYYLSDDGSIFVLREGGGKGSMIRKGMIVFLALTLTFFLVYRNILARSASDQRRNGPLTRTFSNDGQKP